MKKKHVSLPEAKLYLHAMNLKPPISDYIVGYIFYESLLLITDTLKSDRMREM